MKVYLSDKEREIIRLALLHSKDEIPERFEGVCCDNIKELDEIYEKLL